MSALFPRSIEEQELADVRHALAEVLDQPDASVADRADGLVAIARQHRIRHERLLSWIYDKFQGKEWSLAEWHRWCQKWIETCEGLGVSPDVEGELLTEEPRLRICPRCLSHVAERLGHGFFCPRCGVIE